MPQRFLKPGFRESPRYNQASWPAQSLFTRLISLVDDYGRYDAHPLLLARVAFPYGTPTGKRISPEQAKEWLDNLENLDLLVTYEANGVKILQLNRWTERIRTKNPSRFPPPPTANVVTRQHLTADVVKSCQMTANAAPSTSTSTSTSTEEREKGASLADVNASRTQAGALLAQIRILEGRKECLTDAERQELRKKRRLLEELQKKQAARDFSPLSPEP